MTIKITAATNTHEGVEGKEIVYEETEFGNRPLLVGEEVSAEYEVLASHCQGRNAWRRNDAGGTESTDDPCPFLFYQDGNFLYRLELDLMKVCMTSELEIESAKVLKQWVEPGLKFRLKLDVENEPYQIVWAKSLSSDLPS